MKRWSTLTRVLITILCLGSLMIIGCESPDREIVAHTPSGQIDRNELDRWQKVFRSNHERSGRETEAMRFLIRSSWIREEAARLGISVQHSEVQAAIAEERERLGPAPRQFA